MSIAQTVSLHCVIFLYAAIAELQLTISSTPDPGDTTFPAGSSVALTCHVDGGHPPLSYQWSSTCDQQCFVTGQTTQSIAQSVLHSSDSGNHTCDVKDYVGHTGSTYIEMIVSGGFTADFTCSIKICEQVGMAVQFYCRCWTTLDGYRPSPEQQHTSCL